MNPQYVAMKPNAQRGGSAGASLDNVGLYDKPWSEFFDDDFGIGRITVANSTHMHWEFIRNKENDDKGAVVDDTWLIK